VIQVGRRLVGLVSFVTLLAAPPASPSGETVNKTLGVLPAGKTVVVRFKATVDSPFPSHATQVSTQGTVSGSNFSSVLTDDPDVGGMSDPTVTPVDAAPDLVITKTDGATSTAAGQLVVYALGVANVGDQGAVGVQISETVPDDTTFDAGSSTPGWSCSDGAVAGTVCTYDVGTLPAGLAPVSYNFAVHVVASPVGTTIVNTASITDDGTNGPDKNPANNTATDTDTLGASVDLSITKTDGRSLAVSGAKTVYTITVSNPGPAGAVGATVTDAPPATLTNVTWTCAASNGATCTASGSGPINDTVNLPSGSSVVYTLTATVDPLATGTVSNTATVAVPSGTTDPVPGNNTATDTDTIVAKAISSDFDGDGRSDIALFNTVTGEVREWRMNAFVVNDVSVGVQGNLNARIVGTGDYDGNGQSDLLWQDQTTFALTLWMNGTTTGPALPVPPFAFAVAPSGDYDGDGISDILWHNTTTKELVLWLMGASGVNASQSVGTIGPSRTVRGAEDFNNDGRADVLLLNGTTLATQVRFMDGFTPTSTQGTGQNALLGFDVVGSTHFRADPQAIVVWHKFKATQPELWMMNGASVTRGFTSQSKTGKVDVVGTGDYDGDGHGDILWYNANKAQLRLWRMNGLTVLQDQKIGTFPSPAANWIVVRAR
jgi:uncharacterized repeat protein (TIGR01451 family)